MPTFEKSVFQIKTTTSQVNFPHAEALLFATPDAQSECSHRAPQSLMLISLRAPSPPDMLSLPSPSDRKPLPAATTAVLCSRVVSRRLSRSWDELNSLCRRAKQVCKSLHVAIHYHIRQQVRVDVGAVRAQHTCNRSKLVSNLSTFSSRSSPADTPTSSRRPSFRRMSLPLCSSWDLAWGNSWRASIRSCLERQKRSEYPRLRILAVRLLPILLPLMLRMLISPKQLPEVRTANCVAPSSPTTASWPSFMMYISLPTSPLEKDIIVICDTVSS